MHLHRFVLILRTTRSLLVSEFNHKLLVAICYNTLLTRVVLSLFSCIHSFHHAEIPSNALIQIYVCTTFQYYHHLQNTFIYNTLKILSSLCNCYNIVQYATAD
jgi:hypothetical protein